MKQQDLQTKHSNTKKKKKQNQSQNYILLFEHIKMKKK